MSSLRHMGPKAANDSYSGLWASVTLYSPCSMSRSEPHPRGHPVHAYFFFTYFAMPSQLTEFHRASGKSSTWFPPQFLMGTSCSDICMIMAPGVPVVERE